MNETVKYCDVHLQSHHQFILLHSNDFNLKKKRIIITLNATKQEKNNTML